MRAVILGGTGFIGTMLVRRCLDMGWEVVVPSRSPERCRERFSDRVIAVSWGQDAARGRDNGAGAWEQFLDGADLVVNLVGENIASGRWTGRRKKRIVASRVRAGQAVVRAVRRAANPPAVLVQASAIGYYGSRGDEVLDEYAARGGGFLADTSAEWEDSTSALAQLGVRRVVVRTGVVLESHGGALPKFLTPFRFFAGGPLGSGTQWMSWIHLEDQVRAILHLAGKPDASGPYNLVAPEPVTMDTFCATLGRVMRRPSWFRVPAGLLRLALGEMADELVLCSQRVDCARLIDTGFEFRYPGLEPALKAIVDKAPATQPEE